MIGNFSGEWSTRDSFNLEVSKQLSDANALNYNLSFSLSLQRDGHVQENTGQRLMRQTAIALQTGLTLRKQGGSALRRFFVRETSVGGFRWLGALF